MGFINFQEQMPTGSHVYSLRKQHYAIVQWDDKKSNSIKINAKKHTETLHPIIGESKGDFIISLGIILAYKKNIMVPSGIEEINIAPTYYNIERLLSLVGKNKVYFTNSFLVKAVGILKNRINFLQEKDFLENLTEKNIKEHYNTKSNIELFFHQKVGVTQLVKMKIWGLLWEPGTGKTATVAVAIRELIDSKKIKKAIIVVRATLREQWKNELEKFASIKAKIIITDNFNEMKEDGVFIVSYSGLVINNKKAKKFINEDTFLCLDESTEIKNYSLRTKGILRLGKLAGRKCILTGTIVSEKVENAFYQIKFLDLGERLGTSKDDFKEEFFGENSLERISDRIFDISSRYRLDDIAELPPISVRTIALDMDDQHKSLYRTAVLDTLASLEEYNIKGAIHSPIPLVTLIRTRQITGGFVSVKDTIDGKVDSNSKSRIVRIKNDNDVCVKEKILEELVSESKENKQQVLIWTNFSEETNIVRDVFKRLCISNYAVIDGKTKDSKRNEYCDNYQAGKIEFLVSGTKTLQFGKNLQATNRMIYYSTSYSYMDFSQALARARRIGLKHKVEAIILAYRNTIDMSMVGAIEDKKELSSLINKDTIKDIIQGEI